MLWMTLFHLCFDLNHFGFLQQNFRLDPLWTWQRVFIVSLFLCCAGMGQALACAQQQTWARFGRRWAQIVSAALLVTAGSVFVFPQSFIYFGVLHGMAVMLLLLRWMAPWAQRHLVALSAMGAVLIAARSVAQWLLEGSAWAPIFNHASHNWLGLISQKPNTEDYVPLVPWMGVMLWGFALGTWLLRRHATVVHVAVPAWGKPLSYLGRWSLSYYLLHQPVLIGLLMLITGRWA